MRKSFRKLLSLLLAIGILAGCFVFAPTTALAAEEPSVSLVLNGGKLVNPDVTYKAGSALPNYEGITKGNDTFGGWYTTPNFQGTQVFTAAEGGTYYARWVKHEAVITDFEKYTKADYDGGKVNTNERGSGDADFRIWDRAPDNVYKNNATWSTLNISKYNTYSGNNSMRFDIEAGDGVSPAYEFGETSKKDWFAEANTTKGVCLWVSTNAQIKLKFQGDYGNSTNSEVMVTIPSGKHIITFPDINKEEEHSKFIFMQPSSNARVYIDDIGTFSDVVHDVNYETFDSYDTIENMLNVNRWADWDSDDTSSRLSLNSDSEHIYNGAHSIKVTATANNQATYIATNRMAGSREGDGFSFWIEAPVGTQVMVQYGGKPKGQDETTDSNNPFRYNTTVTVTSANGQFFDVPWSKLKKETDINYASMPEWFTAVKDDAAYNLYEFAFKVTLNTTGDIAYVDEFGIYDEAPAAIGSITYKPGYGQWAENYTAPTNYAHSDVALPGVNNITRYGYVFGGWYDGTGKRVIVTPESGDLTLTARWVLRHEAIDTFESGLSNSWSCDIHQDDANAVAEISLNNNKTYSGMGDNSLKLYMGPLKSSIEDERFYAKLKRTGLNINTNNSDGFCFWIDSEFKFSDIKVKLNQLTTVYELRIYNASKFVVIPWSDLGIAKGTPITDINIAVVPSYNVSNTVYIDELYTYTDATFNNIETSLTTAYDLFVNKTEKVLTDAQGNNMANESFVYTDRNNVEKTAFRFVSGFKYYENGGKMYADKDYNIEIVKRGMKIGVKNNAGEFVQLTKSEKAANATAWTKANGTLEYSFLMSGIKEGSCAQEFYAQPYLIVKFVGDETLYTVSYKMVGNSIKGIVKTAADYRPAMSNYKWYGGKTYEEYYNEITK